MNQPPKAAFARLAVHRRCNTFDFRVPEKDLRSKDFLGRGAARVKIVMVRLRSITEKLTEQRRIAASSSRQFIAKYALWGCVAI